MPCYTLTPFIMYCIQNMLSTYNIIEANPIDTPIIKGSTILLSKSEDAEFNITDYQRLVGKLMYLSQTIRPNLAFVVSSLRQYMADPHLGY